MAAPLKGECMATEKEIMKKHLKDWIKCYGIKSLMELVLAAFNELEDNKE